MSTTRALVIGVDDYLSQPLTTCVSDARAFVDTVVDLGMVSRSDVVLLLAPEAADGALATRAAIKNAVLDIAERSAPDDRLFFYFAGHGMLTFTDAAQTRPETVIMPVDADLGRNQDLMISLDELQDYLLFGGPGEQYYFIDACRNMPYRDHPIAGRMSWTLREKGVSRRQSTIYAVSEFGKAVGAQSGVMTARLVEGLSAAGVALDYDRANDRYVVTMESVLAHLEATVPGDLADLGVDPRIGVPVIAGRSKVPPLRVVDSVTDRPFVLRVDPAEAAAATTAVLAISRVTAAEWPPRAYESTVHLPPQRFQLTVSSTAGAPHLESDLVDLRTISESTITIRASGPEGIGAPSVPRIEHSDRADVVHRPAGYRTDGDDRGPLGRLAVSLVDSDVSLEIDGLDYPHYRDSRHATFSEWVPAGAYRVVARLGPDIVGEWSTLVGIDQVVSISMDESLLGTSSTLDALEFARRELRDRDPGLEARDLVVVVDGAAGSISERGDRVLDVGVRLERPGRTFLLPFAMTPGYGTAVAVGEDRRGRPLATVALVRLGPEGDRDSHDDFISTGPLLLHDNRPKLPYSSDKELVERVRADPLLVSAIVIRSTSVEDISSPRRRAIIAEALTSHANETGEPVPDVAVALSRLHPDQAPQLLGLAAESGRSPLLADSVRILAEYLTELGVTGHPLQSLRARLLADQPFAVAVEEAP